MIRSQLVIPKVWRSELKGLVVFLLTSGMSVYLSAHFPGSILEGKFFTFLGYTFYLTLPLWSLLPFFVLTFSIFRIYNVRFVVDEHGIEARVGILSFHQRITRLRYEDIRSIEIEHSLIERALDIGDVEVSTASTGDVEIVLQGVAAPEEVQDMLQRERMSRQRAGVRRIAEAQRVNVAKAIG